MIRAPVSCAIVGLGRWGQNLVTAVTDMTDPPLLIHRAMTRTPARAQRFCDRLDLPLSDDFEDVLADPDIEAVILATPHSQHRDQVVAAARAGKHVFVEKPFALTVSDAKDMIAACQQCDRHLAVGFNRRFLPAFETLQAKLSGGDIGTPLLIEGQFSGPWGFGYSADMWRGSTAENPAGGMAAMGIHVLDAMIALMGPVAAVRTLSKRQALTASLDDTTVTMLDFTSGAVGTLSTLMASPTYWRLHIGGTEAWAAMSDQATLDYQKQDGPLERQVFPAMDPLAAELAAFALLITDQVSYPVKLSDALHGVAAMQAIALSAAQGGKFIEVSASDDT